MASLASINTQLSNVESQITANNEIIREKREELRRLKEAQADVIATRNDFLGEEEICEEPEFSPKTFHGSNSTTYDAYRRVHLKESFREIPVTQMMEAIAKMQEKINELVEEIAELGDDNRELGNRLVGLTEQREAELKASKEGSK